MVDRRSRGRNRLSLPPCQPVEASGPSHDLQRSLGGTCGPTEGGRAHERRFKTLLLLAARVLPAATLADNPVKVLERAVDGGIIARGATPLDEGARVLPRARPLDLDVGRMRIRSTKLSKYEIVVMTQTIFCLRSSRLPAT